MINLTHPTELSLLLLPRSIEALGPDATKALIDFFTAQIRNKNTRQRWCCFPMRRATLGGIRP